MMILQSKPYTHWAGAGTRGTAADPVSTT